MKKILLAFTYASALFVVSACNDDDENVAPLPNLDTFLSGNADLSMYAAAIEKAGLQDFKNGVGPFTWIAPTNAAFTAAGITQDSLNRMSQGDANYLMTYHILNPNTPGNTPISTENMIAQNSFPRATVQGSAGVNQVYLANNGVGAYVNGNTITSANNALSNGMVHVINRVNIPPARRGNVQNLLLSTGQHSLFIQALTKAGRWAQLSTASVFSVLAPTNTAMRSAGLDSTAIAMATTATVDSIVRYHYFNNIRLFTPDMGTNKETPQTALGPGRTITALNNGMQLRGKGNSAAVNVSNGNLLGTNGLIQVLDGVLRFR